MILISLLIAIILEYQQRVPESDRRFVWYGDWAVLIESRLKKYRQSNPWLTLILQLASIPLLLALFFGALSGFFFWIVECGISAYVLVHCIGPEILRLRYEHYLQAIKRQDYEAGFLSLGEALGHVELKDLPRAVTQLIIVQVNCNYFAVLIWFILLGAPGALFYRLMKLETKRQDKTPQLQRLEYFMDWIPSRLLALTFALVGNFDRCMPVLKDCLLNYHCPPNEVITKVGIAALSRETLDEYGEFSENRHAIEMMQRTVLAILVATAILTMLGWLP